MKTFKEHLFTISLLMIPFIALLFIWPQLPEQVPVHWGLSGEVDRYGSRWQIFVLPIINVVLFVSMFVIPIIDPKKRVRYESRGYRSIISILILFMVALFGFQVMVSLGFSINMENFGYILLLLLFAFLGNFMAKIPPNYFIGVRTPWTLENEDIWRKTHRLTGYLWVFGAAILFLIRFLIQGKAFMYILFGGIITLSIIPILFSLYLHNQVRHQQ